LFTDEEKRSVRREIENQQRAGSHVNIIVLYEVYETPEYLYLVLEPARRGTLHQMLVLRRRLPEAEAMRILQQLLRAIAHLHECGVIHCDVKPHK
jgi:serine/threonine protein kinase